MCPSAGDYQPIKKDRTIAKECLRGCVVEVFRFSRPLSFITDIRRLQSAKYHAHAIERAIINTAPHSNRVRTACAREDVVGGCEKERSKRRAHARSAPPKTGRNGANTRGHVRRRSRHSKQHGAVLGSEWARCAAHRQVREVINVCTCVLKVYRQAFFICP